MNLDLEVRNCGSILPLTWAYIALISGGYSAAGTGLVRQLSVYLCGAADTSRLLSGSQLIDTEMRLVKQLATSVGWLSYFPYECRGYVYNTLR
jgi:hypothetical protein